MRTLHNRSFQIVLVLVASVSATDHFAQADDLKPVTTVPSVNGVCSLELEAAVLDNPFPAAGPGITLRSPVYILRNANGIKSNDSGLVGPIVRIGKGDTLRILLKNRLNSGSLPSELPDPPENYPRGYAVTNLHTHGLHVSPSGKADNVYKEIKPNESHQFEYQLLTNHAAGTFWYHPHKHGAVALQLTGGMAGALIVDGDLDEVVGPKKMNEQILVLQQIHGRFDPTDPTQKRLVAQPNDIYDKLKNPPTSTKSVPARSRRFQDAQRKSQNKVRAATAAKAAAKPGDAKPPEDCPPPASVDPSQDNEWLLVNGQWLPTIRMQPGEIQRWRFVHAGLDEVINLAVVTKDENGKETYVKLQEIAVDGLPRGRKVPHEQQLIYPGYRWDALIQAPKDVPAGQQKTLCLYSEAAPAGATLSGFPTDRLLIARIIVSGAPMTMDFPTDDALAQCVPGELRSPISDREVGNRRWSLKFDFPDHDSSVPSQLLINGSEFGSKIDRFVRLNTAEEWRIESGTGTSNAAGHPFHIHVNPFLHYLYRGVLSLKVKNPPGGMPLSPATLLKELGSNVGDTLTFAGTLWTGDKFSSSTPVSEISKLGDLESNLNANLNKLFRDSYQVGFDDKTGTVLIRPLRGNIEDLSISYSSSTGDSASFSFTRDEELVDQIWRDTLMAPSGRSEVVRMRFRDWTGDTVLHCHIVDHEDQGMMKNIRILGPDEPIPAEGSKIDMHDKTGQLTKEPDEAPSFALPDAAGRIHQFGEFAGKKLILVFFRGTDCLPCSRQLQSFVRIQDRLREAGVTFVAISSAGKEDLRKAQSAFSSGKGPPFTILCDPDRTTFKRYGCQVDEDEEAQHGTFVIDSRGKIRWRHVGDEPYENIDKVLEESQRLETDR